MARLCTAGETLRDQINKRFPKRDKRSDGWIGDSAHQARKSDHNPDAQGVVWAIDVDENMGTPGIWRRGKACQRLANQLIAYARSGLPGADRIKYVVYEDRIASGTYRSTWWRWRGKGYGHTAHMHVSFQPGKGAQARRFPLPILAPNRKTMKAWQRQLDAALAGKA